MLPGAQYKFAIKYNNTYRLKNDPRARDLTNSVGTSIVYDPAAYQWQTSNFQIANWNELVIYEMHIGTFGTSASGSPPATFTNAISNRVGHVETGFMVGVGSSEGRVSAISVPAIAQ